MQINQYKFLLKKQHLVVYNNHNFLYLTEICILKIALLKLATHMSRRLSKLIFFAGVDEEKELEHRIGGTHRVDS